MTTRNYFISCWREELPITVNCLRNVPEERWNWQPHRKTRTAKELIDHIVCHAEDLEEGVQNGIINHRLSTNYASIDEAIHQFEQHSANLLNLIAATNDDDWNHKIIPLVVFGSTAFELCMRDMCWRLFFDVIHHRGQLSIYYRPMGVPNPSIYGPTAEIMEARLAELEGKN